MAGFWESLLPGGLGLWGYSDLMGNIDQSQRDINQQISGLQDYVTQNPTFTPYSIKSGIGNIRAGDDGMRYELTKQQRGIQDSMFGMGQDMLGRASGDVAGREQEIYDRIRAAQQPEEFRYRAGMAQALQNQGRGGIRSAPHGGTPEQLAYEKARAEAQNDAMLKAMQFADQERQTDYRMGTGMMGMGYDPMKNLLAFSQPALQYGRLRDEASRYGMSNYLDLALGGMGTNLNYDVTKANMFGDLIQAGSGMMGGFGQIIDKAIQDAGGYGSLWDEAKRVIGL